MAVSGNQSLKKKSEYIDDRRQLDFIKGYLILKKKMISCPTLSQRRPWTTTVACKKLLRSHSKDESE
jgi:hypothetical protein